MRLAIDVILCYKVKKVLNASQIKINCRQLQLTGKGGSFFTGL